MTPAEMVREFHETFGLVIREDQLVETISLDEITLRERLLKEEVRELTFAMWCEDVTRVAAELADVIYVVYGTALHYGIDLDAVVAEVHRANMSKLGSDGRPITDEGGKVVKGPNYRPPDVAKALAA